MKVGVAIFPGSNGDHDALYAMGETLGQDTEPIWHTQTDVSHFDLIILPGRLLLRRLPALRRYCSLSPVMDAIKRYAEEGGPVLGICNGFQVLAEAHMLPGALIRNDSRAFSCRWIHARLRVLSLRTPQRRPRGHRLAPAHRPRRGPLLRRSRHPATTAGKQADCPHLHQRRGQPRGRCQPQRLLPRHCGHLQHCRQCARPHASPRARCRNHPR